MIGERAPAKVNLLLHVGPRREDGLHEICSLYASIDLVDDLAIEESPSGHDEVVCPGVAGPNLCDRALAELRAAGVDVPPLAVTVEKRIPVAAGLGGGSADAAAVLRAANRLTGSPLDAHALRDVAARVGADVPSQVEPHHALVRGAGEVVEPIGLPPMALVLVPQAGGLSTAEVYAEADRIGAVRDRLDPAAVRALAGAPLDDLAPSLGNDLQAAATSLRPELERSLLALDEAGALASLVTGSGPTAFGVFATTRDAEDAATGLPGSLVARLAPA